VFFLDLFLSYIDINNKLLVHHEVIQKCQEKDEIAYKKLYDATIAYVYSVTGRYIQNKEELKDQVQETYATVFKKINLYDNSRGEFKSWIRQVCVNQCLMHIRSQKKLSILNIVEISEVTEPISNDVPLDEMTRNDIEIILNKMPEGYKLVFMLYVIDGYSHSEIQELLSIKKETSRSQLARAKKWIKKNFTHYKNDSVYGLN